MPVYTWTDASALYQVYRGQKGSESTLSAYKYLELRLAGNNARDVNDMLRIGYPVS